MNRQVPERYCLIGNGRLARHMAHYFDLLGISHTRWYRGIKPSLLTRFKHRFLNAQSTLSQAIEGCDHVLLLISDDAIEPFIEQHPELKSHSVIHCSGALQTPLAVSCHPLMTFGETLYELKTYKNIPFVCQQGLDFPASFPQLPNPHHILSTENKASYHAYCVMAGNFPQMMWHALSKAMTEMGLPEVVMHGFIKQAALNFTAQPDQALTGPFVRGDWQVIDKHLAALAGSEMGALYQAFTEWQKGQQQTKQQVNQ